MVGLDAFSETNDRSVQLVSGSKDGVVMLWTVKDDRPIEDMLRFCGEVNFGLD